MSCERAPLPTNYLYFHAGNHVTARSGGKASVHVLTLIVEAQLGADASHHDTDNL